MKETQEKVRLVGRIFTRFDDYRRDKSFALQHFSIQMIFRVFSFDLYRKRFLLSYIFHSIRFAFAFRALVLFICIVAIWVLCTSESKKKSVGGGTGGDKKPKILASELLLSVDLDRIEIHHYCTRCKWFSCHCKIQKYLLCKYLCICLCVCECVVVVVVVYHFM